MEKHGNRMEKHGNRMEKHGENMEKHGEPPALSPRSGPCNNGAGNVIL
ncbi:MAG: hypothetical protein NT040_18600 [Bacteroidetes bacterium]|nr:hypothetical protein [Bacteroidota bacterium]